MKAFDTLIRNLDRHPGNALFTKDGALWWIDHTRSFPPTSSLGEIDHLEHLDAEMAYRIRTLDPRQLRRSLGQYLQAGEMAALLNRHREMIGLLRSSPP